MIDDARQRLQQPATERRSLPDAAPGAEALRGLLESLDRRLDNLTAAIDLLVRTGVFMTQQFTADMASLQQAVQTQQTTVQQIVDYLTNHASVDLTGADTSLQQMLATLQGSTTTLASALATAQGGGVNPTPTPTPTPTPAQAANLGAVGQAPGATPGNPSTSQSGR